MIEHQIQPRGGRRRSDKYRGVATVGSMGGAGLSLALLMGANQTLGSMEAQLNMIAQYVVHPPVVECQFEEVRER